LFRKVNFATVSVFNVRQSFTGGIIALCNTRSLSAPETEPVFDDAGPCNPPQQCRHAAMHGFPPARFPLWNTDFSLLQFGILVSTSCVTLFFQPAREVLSRQARLLMHIFGVIHVTCAMDCINLAHYKRANFFTLNPNPHGACPLLGHSVFFYGVKMDQKRIVREQLLHLFFGAVIFAAIAQLAVALDLFATWISHLGVSPFTAGALSLTAHGMLVVDLVLFFMYLGASSIDAIREMK
jgi:hypothetical protein